jgi:hypothetical protein
MSTTLTTTSDPEPTDAGIRCSIFAGCRDNSPRHLNWTWEQLISPDGLGKPYMASGATREEAKLTLPAFSPAAYPSGAIRGDRNVESIQILMLDFDNKAEQPTGEVKENGEPVFQKAPIVGAPTLEEVCEHLKALGITHFGYHSFSSTPECERFRIMIPLSQASDGKNWKIVSEWLLAQLHMDEWRSMGCLDLGALHRTSCLYFAAGYWSQDPEAKDRIRFVSHMGVSLGLPTTEEFASMVVAPSVTHPLRKAWAEKKATDRGEAMTGDPKTWFKALGVDVSSLDIVSMARDMGSDVNEPVPYGKGFRARCTCPFASEHTGSKDHGDAVLFFGPNEWPGFYCPHACHEGMGLRELCLEAGPELVQRYAKPFRPFTAKLAMKSRTPQPDVMEGEVVGPIDDEQNEKARREKERQRLMTLLEQQGLDPFMVKFTQEGGIAKSRPNLEYILTCSEDYGGNIRWNELTASIEISVPEYSRLAKDDLDNNLTALLLQLEKQFGTPWSMDVVSGVSALVASANAYHPVLEYLDSIPEWDGHDRFPMLVTDVLGASQTPDFENYGALYAEFMKCTLIGAVRRVLEPGCKMDTVTILYGNQAALKSTFWKTLCASPTWFNDSKVHIDSPEGQKVLQHSWIHELGEIDEMTSIKSAEAIKVFVSSAVDTFRQSYAKAPRAFHRRCIIVGTTNKEEVLNDPTGSRRFWVIPVGKRCDLDLLRENLDQLWAQAYRLCRDGVAHHLNDAFETLREAQSRRHQMENRFADLMPKILEYYQGAVRPNGITLVEILSFIDGKTDESKGYAKPSNADRRDLGACLRIFGWSVKQGWINGASAKCFTPPDDLLYPTTSQLIARNPDMFRSPVPDLSIGPFEGSITKNII